MFLYYNQCYTVLNVSLRHRSKGLIVKFTKNILILAVCC